jgi:hypothetical protein
MKSIHYFLIVLSLGVIISSCEKKDYPKGLDELQHHYYSLFVPNNNTAVTVTRNQAALVKFPVQFYSTYTRDYDVVSKYVVVTGGITGPAKVGIDFNVVDKDGNIIPSADSTYTIVFPKAVQKMDTIYLKMLNNTTPGVRKFEIQLQDNITTQYDADIFSTAYRRPVTIN